MRSGHSNQSTPQELWHYIVTMDTDMVLTFAVLAVALIVGFRYIKNRDK